MPGALQGSLLRNQKCQSGVSPAEGRDRGKPNSPICAGGSGFKHKRCCDIWRISFGDQNDSEKVTASLQSEIPSAPPPTENHL